MLDEHSGHGGSYLLDPETGVRTLIERTLPPQPSQETSDGTATTQTPDRDRDGVDVRDGSNSNGADAVLVSGSEHHSSEQ